MAVGPLRPDQLETRSGEQEGDGGGDGRDEGGQDPPVRLPEPVREMPDRKEPVVPRGDRAAEQPDPQGRVLNESARTGDARSPDAAPDDLEDRQHGHADEKADRNGVLDAGRERRRGTVPRKREFGRRFHRLVHHFIRTATYREDSTESARNERVRRSRRRRGAK